MAAAVHGLVREPFDGVGVAAGKGDGQLVGAGEVAEQLGDLVAQFGVETGGRLVRQQDVGAAGRAGRRRRRRPGRPVRRGPRARARATRRCCPAERAPGRRAARRPSSGRRTSVRRAATASALRSTASSRTRPRTRIRVEARAGVLTDVWEARATQGAQLPVAEGEDIVTENIGLPGGTDPAACTACDTTARAQPWAARSSPPRRNAHSRGRRVRSRPT